MAQDGDPIAENVKLDRGFAIQTEDSVRVSANAKLLVYIQQEVFLKMYDKIKY
jgi:hypothetical protein